MSGLTKHIGQMTLLKSLQTLQSLQSLHKPT
jgi:hypothetical protein